MRDTDRSCIVTAKDGLVYFECAGTGTTLDPEAAAHAGGKLIERAKAARYGKVAGTLERSLRTGEQLIKSAAEAIRQRAASVSSHSIAA